MKTFAMWALIAVNAALAVSLVGRLLKDDRATAQAQATGRDDFLMCPGEIVGGNNAIVYVIDESTHQLSSMSYDDSNRVLATMVPRSMDHDFDQMNQPQPGNGRRLR